MAPSVSRHAHEFPQARAVVTDECRDSDGLAQKGQSNMISNINNSIRAQIVTSWLNGDERGFDDDTDLQSTGILDSFSTLSLVGFIEDTFHIRLDPMDINSETFKSVTTIAELVSSKLRAAE
jgi:acyl carrier protein